MSAVTQRDLERLREQLAETPGDDALRLVYADALEECGDTGHAAAHRAIAGMHLECFSRRADGKYLTDEERFSRERELQDMWELGSADREYFEVIEGLDPKALVPFVELRCAYADADEDMVYVACATCDDLLLSELLARTGLSTLGEE